MKTIFIFVIIAGCFLICCSTVEEKLEFEADNLVFKVIEKNTLQDSVKFFEGFKLNSRTGQFDPNTRIGVPTKGNVFVTFKFNILNNNDDTVKINSESDLIVQTSDGEVILKYTEFPEHGFSPGAFTATLLPEIPKEMEFFLIIPEKLMKDVRCLYKNNEGAIINFKNSMEE